MRNTVSSTLKEASKLKSRKDKIEFLRNNINMGLLRVLHACFDPNVRFLLPDKNPSYKAAYDDVMPSLLLYESKKLYNFMEGGNPLLSQERRETMFIEFLESIHPSDAEMMLSIRKKKMPYPTITETLVREAFPNLLSEKQKEKEESTDVKNKEA